jgi:undecaprenyl-diphosphatase
MGTAGSGAAAGVIAGLTDFRLPFDEPLLRWLNGLSSPAVDTLTTWLGRPLLDWSLAVLAMLWIVRQRERAAAVPLLCALGATGLTDLLGARILKPWFHRMRPFDALPWVHQAFPVSHLGSMPSLHAANAFALATGLSCASPRLAPWLFGCATLIGVSRIVGGVHWPSDVVAGALFGTALGLAAGWAARRYSSARMIFPVRRERRSP